jgi:hypothetical protein
VFSVQNKLNVYIRAIWTAPCKYTNHNFVDAITPSDKLQKLIDDFLIVFSHVYVLGAAYFV